MWEVIYPACKATGEKLKPLLQGREWSASINESAISSTGERSLPFQTVPGFPFSVLRDVTTGRVIGTFSMFTYVPLVSKSDPKPATTTAPVDAAAAAKDMFAGKGQESVAPGDQVWEMAYDLAESARGKGYSVPAVKSAIDNWARWVGIGTVRAVSVRRRRMTTCGWADPWNSKWRRAISLRKQSSGKPGSSTLDQGIRSGLSRREEVRGR